MDRIDLTDKIIKILGTHFSYNKNPENEVNLKVHILKIETVLQFWKMGNLTIEGKITTFKHSRCLKFYTLY